MPPPPPPHTHTQTHTHTHKIKYLLTCTSVCTYSPEKFLAIVTASSGTYVRVHIHTDRWNPTLGRGFFQTGVWRRTKIYTNKYKRSNLCQKFVVQILRWAEFIFPPPHPSMKVCCLLVLNSVNSTSQWIHQSRFFRDVCVLVCKCVYLCSKVPGPFIPRTSLPMPFLAFRCSHFASCRWTPVRYHTSTYRPFRSKPRLVWTSLHQKKGLYVDMRFFDMLHSKHVEKTNVCQHGGKYS